MIAASTTPLLLTAIGLLLVVAVGGYLFSRRSGKEGPDIPPAFEPGPSDAALEKPRLEKLQAWGIVILALTAIWIPVYWLNEANANAAKEEQLTEAAIKHGANEVQAFDEHSNPAGVSCVQCHATDLKGQEVMQGDKVFKAADLTTVCSRLTQDEIRQTIQEGRPPYMPAWGVEYNGALNDQQVNSIVAYLADLSKDTVPMETNKCLNEEAAAPAEATDAPADGEATPAAETVTGGPAATEDAATAPETSPSPAAS